MADIEAGSVYMGGVDKAATAIEQIINTQVAAVIDQVYADGKISHARAIELKKRGARVGAHIVELAVGYHGLLTEAAKDADIDVPPPSDGTAEFIDVLQNMVSPLGGTR